MGGPKKRDLPPPPRCSYNYNFGGETKKMVIVHEKDPTTPLKIGPKTPKTPIWTDFLHFHNHWSEAQNYSFLSLQPNSKVVKHRK